MWVRVNTDKRQYLAMRKTKSVHDSGCGVETITFRRKGNPETYPCLPSFLIAQITMTTVITMIAIDHRERIHLIGTLKMYLARCWIMMFFSLPKRLFLVGILLAFLALLHSQILLSLSRR